VPDAVPIRYRSHDEDSGRWLGFSFRDGDIVISTRSKSGTTWMQMICALLVLQTTELPSPLWQLSPWLDWLGAPRDEVVNHLAAQTHRRFIKTHTPLDGLPLDARATYIVVARHPLDAAVSAYHQGDNLDRDRVRKLTGQPQPSDGGTPRPSADAWLRRWITWDGDPRAQLDSLPGMLLHLRDAWERRSAANVVLVHYDDLRADLALAMRGLADSLGITPGPRWPHLVEAATFDQMQARANELAPDAGGVLKDRARFFRRGTSGEGRALLTDDDRATYLRRAAELAPPDLLTWLHRDESELR